MLNKNEQPQTFLKSALQRRHVVISNTRTLSNKAEESHDFNKILFWAFLVFILIYRAYSIIYSGNVLSTADYLIIATTCLTLVLISTKINAFDFKNNITKIIYYSVLLLIIIFASSFFIYTLLGSLDFNNDINTWYFIRMSALLSFSLFSNILIWTREVDKMSINNYFLSFYAPVLFISGVFEYNLIWILVAATALIIMPKKIRENLSSKYMELRTFVISDPRKLLLTIFFAIGAAITFWWIVGTPSQAMRRARPPKIIINNTTTQPMTFRLPTGTTHVTVIGQSGKLPNTGLQDAANAATITLGAGAGTSAIYSSISSNPPSGPTESPKTKFDN